MFSGASMWQNTSIPIIVWGKSRLSKTMYKSNDKIASIKHTGAILLIIGLFIERIIDTHRIFEYGKESDKTERIRV